MLRYYNKIKTKVCHSDKMREYIPYFLGFLLIIYYIYRWRTVPNTFGKETWLDFPGFLEGGTTGLWDFITKVFDLSIVEFCEYRPRILGFIVQYLDLKWWMELNRKFGWGGYYPFVIVSMVLTISGIFLILKRIFKDERNGILFLIATFFLFQWNYYATTRFFFRTAKLMAPAISALVIGICIHLKDKRLSAKTFMQEFWLAFGLAFLCTIDEQVVFTVVWFLIGYCVLNLFFQTKNYHLFRVSIFTVIHYLIFYFWYGRAIFGFFTNGELKEHRHTFLGSLKGFVPSMMDGAETLYGALHRSLFDNDFALSLLFLVMVALIISMRFWRDRFIAVYLLLGSFVLTVGLVSAHPAVHFIPELRYTMYLIQSVWMVYISFVFCVGEYCDEIEPPNPTQRASRSDAESHPFSLENLLLRAT